MPNMQEMLIEYLLNKLTEWIKEETQVMLPKTLDQKLSLKSNNELVSYVVLSSKYNKDNFSYE